MLSKKNKENRQKEKRVAHFHAPPKSVILCYKHHHILNQDKRKLKLENRTLFMKTTN